MCVRGGVWVRTRVGLFCNLQITPSDILHNLGCNVSNVSLGSNYWEVMSPLSLSLVGWWWWWWGGGGVVRYVKVINQRPQTTTFDEK